MVQPAVLESNSLRFERTSMHGTPQTKFQVAQSVLEHGTDRHRDAVAKTICSNLDCHKHFCCFFS